MNRPSILQLKRGFALIVITCLLAGILAGQLTACGQAVATIGPAATSIGTVTVPSGVTAVTSATVATRATAVTGATAATGPPGPAAATGPSAAETIAAAIREDGRYSLPADVALYLHLFGKLPRNFITKGDAEKRGWNAGQGNLWDVTDRMSIGGDTFGNREGLLPARQGRTWRECDVNYNGGFRGGERIVYSNDGLIYYSRDHYANFVRLY